MRSKTQPCTGLQARARLEHAHAYLDVAEMVAADDSDTALRGVAAGLAVLAGIAASDTACCERLGERARGTNHHDAEALLKRIGGPDAASAAVALKRLIDLKDKSHYGFTSIATRDRGAALKAATRLVAFADSVVN